MNVFNGLSGIILSTAFAITSMGENFVFPADKGVVITEAGRPATTFTFGEEHEIRAAVNKSSSKLVYPLPEPVQIRKLDFYWKSSAPDQKYGKADTKLRIGLVLSGNIPWIMRLFAPDWVFSMEHVVKTPFNSVIYMDLGTGIEPGSVWDDLKDRWVKHIALADLPTHWEGNWRASSVVFSQPYEVCGIIIQADGDDTQSEFLTLLKDLTFE